MSVSGLEVEARKENGVHFDRTINLGHIMTILTLMVGMAGAYTTYKVSMTEHETRINRLEEITKSQISVGADITSNIYAMKQDLAIIKFRIERELDKKP
jgi:hypothetical protein